MIWYYATCPRATIGFAVENGRVVECAPYMYKRLIGQSEERVFEVLKTWEVQRM